jgi:hypothetical protein
MFRQRLPLDNSVLDVSIEMDGLFVQTYHDARGFQMMPSILGILGMEEKM